MNQPLQNPPVDRLYMRSVIGRQAPLEPTAKASRGSAKPPKGNGPQPGGDYVIGLTTFHIRPRGRW